MGGTPGVGDSPRPPPPRYTNNHPMAQGEGGALGGRGTIPTDPPSTAILTTIISLFKKKFGGGVHPGWGGHLTTPPPPNSQQ